MVQVIIDINYDSCPHHRWQEEGGHQGHVPTSPNQRSVPSPSLPDLCGMLINTVYTSFDDVAGFVSETIIKYIRKYASHNSQTKPKSWILGRIGATKWEWAWFQCSAH